MSKSHDYRVKSTTGRMIPWSCVASVVSAVAPGAAARVAERLFISTIRARPPGREAAWARRAQRITVPSDHGDLAAWVWGEGARTALLVHGWSGRGLQLGALATALAKEDFRVVAYDGPGHGESPGRTSSLVELAAAVTEVSWQLGPVHTVVAHSLGMTAVMLALARGELAVERIVALAPAARLDLITDRFGLMTGFSPRVMQRMKERVGRRFDFDWTSSEPLRIAPSMSASLRVIHDTRDRHIPLAEGEALAATWPGATLSATSGLGHHRLLRDPQVTAEVAEFAAGAALTCETPPTPRVTGRRIPCP